MNPFSDKRILPKLVYIEILCFVCLILGIVFLLNKQNLANEELKIAIHFRHTSFVLSNELRQTSDDLTRLVRSYTITGDSIYRDLFYMTRDIRDGKVIRPSNYNQLIWGENSSSKIMQMDNRNEGTSLVERIKKAGFTKEELTILISAKNVSDSLIDIEEVAMEGMSGWFKDREGNYTIHKKPDQKFAVDTLYSKQYNEFKISFIALIQSFITVNDDRAFYMLVSAHKKNGTYSLVLLYLFIGFVLFVPLLVFTVYRNLRVVESDVRKSEARYRFLATQPKQLVYDYDLKSGAVYWSGDVIGVTGKSRAAFESIDMKAWIGFIHPEDQDRVEMLHYKAIAHRSKYEAIYRLKGESNTYRYVEDIGSFIFNMKKEPIQMLGMIKDISERKKNEEEKAHLHEQLNHKNKMDAIGQLAGGVAHDFNNVLGGIMGAASMLKNPKNKLNERSLKFVDLIQQSSERAADLTAKLLAFGHKSKLTSTPVNINIILDDTIALLNSAINKNIGISLIKKAENYVIIGDDSDLQNAFLNIGINASHAMKGGGKLIFKTRDFYLDSAYCNASPFDLEEGEYIEIEIQDTGCGMPLEVVSRIFEPFYTTKEKGEGTGLGLAAVYGTIEEHKGAVLVYSEIGVGTVFQIYLPYISEIKSKEVKNVEIIHGKGKILLVDDEEIVRVTGKYMLEELGYEVFLAQNAEEAIEFYKRWHSDITLVIMDMIMPGLSGRDAFYEMKKIDEQCNVILSSGFSKSEKMDPVMEDGLKGFIQKPYRDFELSQKINSVLHNGP